MKLFFKQKENFLTLENKKFIEEEVLGLEFPYFFQEGAVNAGDKDICFIHAVLKRLEHSNNHRNAINTNNTIYDSTLSILNNFCKSIGEKPNFYTRIAYNVTIPNKNKECKAHRDHIYDHKQIIIYLNESTGSTFIVDKILKEIKHKKYKGICFNNLPHYQRYPEVGGRVVLVATYI